ncbi:MAG TPA: hypothetical protein VF179_07990 [Thermoanaerobaculia bacterium]|nr:hypothetical protein [Thermoanaerobaculia bacterium]
MRRPTLFRSLLGCCLALALACPARAALNRWSSGGPFGGQILELEFDPADPAIVYAGTFGGVFRSEDHGATWTAASSGLADAAVGEFAVDPDTPGTLYVVTDRGVQRSLDRGISWQLPTLTLFPDGLALDPSNPKTLYSSTFGTIQKSTNGGASWLPRQKLGSRISFIEIDPLDPAAIFAASDVGLFRSLDGGSTWNPAGPIDAEFLITLEIDPAKSQVLYVGTEDGIFKSTDRGASWSRQGLAGETIEDIAIDPSSPSTLLALSNGVYRSTNAGASWTLLDDRFLNSVALGIDPSSSAWFVGSSDGVYKSTDRGASWFPSTVGITASAVNDLIVDPHRPGVLYATASNSSIYKSGDAGASWNLLQGISLVNALAVDPKTPSVLYAGTGRGLWRSQDAGATWVQVNAAEGNVVQLAVDPENPSTMYLGKTLAGVRKSVDGGLNWSPSGPDVAGFSAHLLVIAPSDPQTLFTAGFPDGLFKSADGGATWVEIGGGLPSQEINTIAVDPRDADVLYAAPSGGRIHKSTDGGATWFPSGNGLTFSSVEGIAVDPSDSSRLYASNSGLGVFRSTNGGASWTRFDEGAIPGISVQDIVIDPVNPYLLYASTFGGGVLARADLPPGPGSLRLNDGRFLVAMSWATGQGAVGRGHTQALTGDTGYAWFFQESNVEVLLKVLDGCGLNGRFWVFAAGLTDVRTDITVGDMETGAIKIYHNPPGQPFQPIQDTSALACAPGTGLVALKKLSAASGPSEPILLRNGRFRVTAEFAISPIADHHPAQGALLTDDAAYLWFFDQNNVEVFLKVVDGCALNGRFWVFAAGLTDLEMRITVEDTKTGASKVYTNPQGTAFRPVQDTSAFGGCG